MSDNDVNKIQQNVKELQNQNAIDFQQWKRLGKEIEKLSEKIKLSDTNLVTLMKKIKSDYENLKRIIIDENIQVQLNNKIEEIKNEIVDSKNKIELNKNEINKKVNKETFEIIVDETKNIQQQVDNLVLQQGNPEASSAEITQARGRHTVLNGRFEENECNFKSITVKEESKNK